MRNRLLPLVAVLLCAALALSAAAAWAEEAAGTPSLALDQTELTLAKGKTQQLKTKLENVENPKKAKYTWESSDAEVATVDREGTVKARDGGTAQITCTAELEDGSTLTVSATVIVTVPVSEVKITTKGNTPVAYGESLQLEYTVKPENATDQMIQWTSSKEEILQVDENGVVTALAAGKASITATSSNGKTSKVTLYVPTLSPSADTFTVTMKDNIFHFTYCGANFDKDVKITVKGDCFDYSLVRNDPDIGVMFSALKIGEGTLTVKDQRDENSRFSISVAVTQDAFPAGRMLMIKNAAYDSDTGVLTMTWANTGDRTVTGAEIRINPLDADGNAVLIGDGYMEEILLEERVLHTSIMVNPGQEATVSFATAPEYLTAAGLEVAFDRFEQTRYADDGTAAEITVTELPDDRLCWYSTQENAYTQGPESGEPYTAPENEVFTQAAGAHIGITVIAVPGELAEAYGFICGGLMITAVEEGSPADRFGLQAGDLVFSVNGMDYEEEPYMMTYAAAGLAAGRPVTMLLQRDNEFWTLNLVNSDQDSEQ